MVFAYYATGHEFGHATRVAEMVRHLILAGHDVHVVIAVPEFVFTNEVHSPCLFFRKGHLMILQGLINLMQFGCAPPFFKKQIEAKLE
ncbi:L-arabinokinase-like isoform X2 [Arachis stenosperma]|uniref:L-arabinokinase-like isoform X2 n=1 Tax=Arachis stenosperma TaxID=217475 RepID=UPI0025AD4B16|nr:L-arabinokinase-like isoform X2 [Arachis stenosperma]